MAGNGGAGGDGGTGDEPECTEDTDCDDGSDCTTDTCEEIAGVCTTDNVPTDTPCDFDGGPGLCVDGVCEEDEACQTVDCSDGIDCTDDICVQGECTRNVPNDANCVDGDSCTDDICDPVMDCQNPAVPDYSLCDDGAAGTDPDICRSGACIGATQGEIDTGNGTFEAVDIVKTSETYIALLNEGPRVHVFDVQSPTISVSRGSESGEGQRLHARGTTVYVAAGTSAFTSGGLNCDSGFSGPCPLLGMYESGQQVVWNGTPIHDALNGLALSTIYDIHTWVDSELIVCQNPPCFSDVYWWVVGRRLNVGGPRPHVISCLEDSPTQIACQVISPSYNSAAFDGTIFVGVEVSEDGGIQNREFNAAIFGLDEGDEATVLADNDKDPDDSLGGGRLGPFAVGLNGSFRRLCNEVIQYGDGAAVVCGAPNVSSNPFFGCEAGAPWTCTEAITANNFVHGTLAGRSLLVTPTDLFVHVRGDTTDPSNWTSIDFGLGSGVELAAAAGDGAEWVILANDTNTGKVRIFRFVF